MKPNVRITIATLAIVLLTWGQGLPSPKRIYVGNPSFTATEDEVKDLFADIPHISP